MSKYNYPQYVNKIAIINIIPIIYTNKKQFNGLNCFFIINLKS